MDVWKDGWMDKWMDGLTRYRQWDDWRLDEGKVNAVWTMDL